MHITILDNITIPNIASITIQIHKTKQKTNPIHTIINIYRRPQNPKDHPERDKNIQNNIFNALAVVVPSYGALGKHPPGLVIAIQVSLQVGMTNDDNNKP